MRFPDEIKRIRQRCFMTQQDFAKEIKVAFSTVNRWEGGKSKRYEKYKKVLPRP